MRRKTVGSLNLRLEDDNEKGEGESIPNFGVCYHLVRSVKTRQKKLGCHVCTPPDAMAEQV
jgi:hypothetical protein